MQKTYKSIKIFAVLSLSLIGFFGMTHLEESAIKKKELRFISQELRDINKGCVYSVSYSLEDASRIGRVACQKIF